MLILNESSEKILSNALLAKSKLSNMKKQLEILLQKKIRIESEIKILKKSLLKKQKVLSFHLKSSITLEAFDSHLEPTQTTREFLERNIPEVVPHLLELDQLEEEIKDLLREFSEEE